MFLTLINCTTTDLVAAETYVDFSCHTGKPTSVHLDTLVKTIEHPALQDSCRSCLLASGIATLEVKSEHWCRKQTTSDLLKCPWIFSRMYNWSILQFVASARATVPSAPTVLLSYTCMALLCHLLDHRGVKLVFWL